MKLCNNSAAAIYNSVSGSVPSTTNVYHQHDIITTKHKRTKVHVSEQPLVEVSFCILCVNVLTFSHSNKFTTHPTPKLCLLESHSRHKIEKDADKFV